MLATTKVQFRHLSVPFIGTIGVIQVLFCGNDPADIVPFGTMSEKLDTFKLKVQNGLFEVVNDGEYRLALEHHRLI